MKALRRRWKLAVVVAVVISAAAALFSPLLPALAGGVLLGVGLAWLLECLDRTVKTVGEVSSKLGLEVYATLPRLAPAAGGAGAPERQLLTGFPVDHPSVRAFRELGRRLAARTENDGQVIMVTSCIPGEGKSTVSGNLAVSLGQTGARILLVGCDLRRPTLGGMFGQPEEPGLTELLVTGDQSALRKLNVPGIDFIPGGSVPENPADLLDTKRMRDLLEFARTRYDYVVLDAPPILPVTDGQLLAPLADVLLAVIEPCRTQLDMARQLIESLQAVGRKIDGVVLNDRSGLGARHYGVGRDPAETASTVGLVRAPAARWCWAAAAVAVLAIGASWWLAHNGSQVASPVRPLPSVAVSKAPGTAPPPIPERPVARADNGSPTVAASQSLPVAVGEAVVAARPLSPAAPAGPGATGEAPPSFSPPSAGAVREPVVAVAPVVAPPAVSPAGLQSALAALAGSWRQPAPTRFGAADDPAAWSAALGLQLSPLADELAVLLQLNTPLLLETRQEVAGTAWVAVVGREGFKWRVSPPTARGELLSEAELKQLWTGKGYLPWQDPLQLAQADERTAPADRVARLQQLLVKAGTLQQFEQGALDRETIKAVGHLQAANGLRVNGRLTPETLILLYQVDPVFRSPKFTLWQ